MWAWIGVGVGALGIFGAGWLLGRKKGYARGAEFTRRRAVTALETAWRETRSLGGLTLSKHDAPLEMLYLWVEWARAFDVLGLTGHVCLNVLGERAKRKAALAEARRSEKK